MTPQLLINEPPLQVLPTLAKLIGLNEAIVLQQIHYWLHPRINKNYAQGHYWVYNTYGQWLGQFPFLSERTLRRTIKNLETQQLLISHKSAKLSQGKFYTINYGSLKKICFSAEGNVDGLEAEQIPLAPALPSKNPGQASYPGFKVMVTPEGGGQNTPESGNPGTVTDKAPSGNEARQGAKNGNPSHPGGHPTSLAILPPIPGKDSQVPQNPPRNNVIYPRWLKWPTRQADGHPRGQFGQFLWSKWPCRTANPATPPGQFDHPPIDKDTENTPEITLPLLPPKLQDPACGGKQEEEEEEKNNQSLKIPPAQDCFYQQMVSVWNQTVQSKTHPGQPVSLTPHRRHLLEAFRGRILRNQGQTLLYPRDGKPPNGKTGTTPTRVTPSGHSPYSPELGAWQRYCDLIVQSRFLTGENASGFKVTLDWALAPEKAYKILEGAIYDKPKASSLPSSQQISPALLPEEPWETFSQTLLQNLPHSPYTLVWLEVSRRLVKKIGQVRYKAWFSKVHLGDVREGSSCALKGSGNCPSITSVTLHVDGRFVKEYIDANFRFQLLEAFQTLYPSMKHITYRLVQTPGDNS